VLGRVTLEVHICVMLGTDNKHCTGLGGYILCGCADPRRQYRPEGVMLVSVGNMITLPLRPSYPAEEPKLRYIHRESVLRNEGKV